MSEFSDRQRALLLAAIKDYRSGRASLNTLVQRIEGLYEAFDSGIFKEKVFSIILILEQANAMTLECGVGLGEADANAIHKYLVDLEHLMTDIQEPESRLTGDARTRSDEQP